MKTTEDFKNQFLKISKMMSELEKIHVEVRTGDKFDSSEIHTIAAIGNKVDTVNSISRKFGITKGAVSQVVVKLENRGFITKTRSLLNSKEIILTLTDSGQKAFNAHRDLHREMDKEIIKLTESSEEIVENFFKILVKIETNLDKYISLDKKV
jgi:DNA-binding MarR family transcriptional regulator